METNIESEKNEIVLASVAQPVKRSFDRYFLPFSILITGILISSSVLYSTMVQKPSLGANASNQVAAAVKGDLTDDDPMLGDPKAPVTMVEFSDFQCPFCRIFWTDTFPQIKKTYIDTGKVRLVYRDFPLSIHASSEISALAADCANEQGKFWEFHDKIFGEQEKRGSRTTITYGKSDLRTWVSQIGLNMVQYDGCFNSEKYKAEIQNDMNAGQAIGVNGTPGFFINGHAVVGAQPFSVFQQLIDQELAKSHK